MELVAEGEGSPRRLSNHPPELVERALSVGPVPHRRLALDALAEDDFRRTHPFAELAAVV